MKRETALRYACEIAQRVHSINGLLATPGMDSEAVRIRRVHLATKVLWNTDVPYTSRVKCGLEREAILLAESVVNKQHTNTNQTIGG